MEKKILISGMKCEGCANRVKTVLKTIKGIKKIDVSLEKKCAIITYKKEIDENLIITNIETLGFKVEGIE